MKKSLFHFPKLPKVLVVGLSILFVVLAGFVLLEKLQVVDLIHTSNTNNPTAPSGPTKEQQKQQAEADAKAKQAYLDSIASGNTSASTNTSTTGTNVTQTTPAATMTLSASRDGNSVTVLTKIQNITDGTCTLTVKNNTSTTSQTAQVIYQPEFSSCAGFSVPVSSVGTGAWSISVTVTPPSGTTITQSTTLEVT